MEIFGKEAPRHWAKGLPVIPLRVMDKRPFFEDWTRYGLTMPSLREQEEWVKSYGPNNMGLPLGAQSGLACIDIDSDDPEVEKAILKVLPKSPWIRIGQRGKVIAFRYNNTPSRKIFDASGKILLEIISTGGQVVLPPSIHPKTQKPYYATTDLIEVYDIIPLMPEDVEDKLRASLSQVVELRQKGAGGGKFKGIEFVPSGARDTQMNRHAGFLSRAILRGELSVKEALEDMQSWFDTRVEKVENDVLDPKKGQTQIIQYLLKDVTRGKILPPGWDDRLSDDEKVVWGLNFNDAQEEWTLEQIVNYIELQYSQYGKNDIKRHECIQFILTKLSKSVTMDSLTVDKVLQVLKGDTGLPISAFKRQIKELKAGPIEGKSHTEIAVATIKEMNEKHGQLAFWNDELWTWGGSHWESLNDQVVRELIQHEFGNLDLGKRGADHKQITSVIKDQVPQQIKTDIEIEGINFANGFLNKDLKLVPHSPEFGMTYTLPFGYRPELAGKCPRFKEFLSYSWGNDPDFAEKQRALQEAICSTLFGIATSYQRCFLLYGVANTGKSVLMGIVSAIVPDEARSAISPDKWQDRFVAAQFTDKLLNVAGELDEKKKLNGKLFKEIISGEEITTENKNTALFKFRPKAAHWFASNHLPKSPDTTNGFNRRWLILSFSKVVPRKSIVRDLDKIIVYEEIEAIVAWALEAFPDFMQRGDYTYPSSHKHLLNEMSLSNSTVRQWMADNLVHKDGAKTKENEFFRHYFSYCSSTLSARNAPPKDFSLELNQFLAEEGLPQGELVDNVMIYNNLALKERGSK